jgi:radical SAM superfamily enzyme YgiQ (UPF0313 family)
MIGIQSKRGCPYDCSYCTYPLIDGVKVQYADPEVLADEMEQLYREFGVNYFFIVDSIFNIAPMREAAFAEELIRRDLPISWGAFFSPKTMDNEYLATCKRSGLSHMEFGTDSLAEGMLESYHKKFGVDEVIDVSNRCSEMGLYAAHYLIFGGPGETVESLTESIRNAGKIKQSIFFPFAGVRVYPRTEVYETTREEGLVESEEQCLQPIFYLAADFTPESIWEQLHHETESISRWVLPHKYASLQPFMQQLRLQGKKGPLWEFLIRS